MRVTLTVPADGPLTERVARVGGRPWRCARPRCCAVGCSRRPGLLRLAGTGTVGVLRGLALLRRCRPDVLYVSTVTVPLWVLLARLLRIPVVCHVHEAERQAQPLLRRVLALPAWAATAVDRQQPVHPGRAGRGGAPGAPDRDGDHERRAGRRRRWRRRGPS